MRTRNILVGVAVAVAILACIGLILAWTVGRDALGGMPGLWRGWRDGLPHMRTVMGPLFVLRPLAGLVALAVLGGLIWLAVSGTRSRPEVGAGSRAPAVETPESPLDVLKRRYAAGEIDREQYQQMKQDLE